MIYFKIAKKFTSSNFVTAKLKNRKFKEANISVAESGYNCLYSKKKFVFQLLIFSCSIFKRLETSLSSSFSSCGEALNEITDWFLELLGRHYLLYFLNSQLNNS